MEIPSVQDWVQVTLPAREVQVNHCICIQEVAQRGYRVRKSRNNKRERCGDESFTFHVTAKTKRVIGRHCAYLMIFQGRTVETGECFDLKILAIHDVQVLVPPSQTVKLLCQRMVKSEKFHEFVLEMFDRILSAKKGTMKLRKTSAKEPWQAELIRSCENDQIRRVWVYAVILPGVQDHFQLRPYLVETDEKQISGFRKNLLLTLGNVKLSDVTIDFL